MTILHETAALYTRQCTSPLLFCNFQVISQSTLRILGSMGFVWDAISLFVHMCTKQSYACDNSIVPLQGSWPRRWLLTFSRGTWVPKKVM